MKNFFTVLVISLLASVSSNAEIFDEESFCTSLKNFEANSKEDIGAMVDGYTRNDGIAVLCGSKIIDFKKFLTVDSKNLRQGWKERKASQWNDIYCDGAWRAAIENGWTVSFTLTSVDGERFWHKAKCK